MKQFLLRLLRRMGIYHPLQSFYRSCIFYTQRFYLRLQFKSFAGSGYTCNVCGHSYLKFKEDEPAHENVHAIRKWNVIAGYGKNIICPYCMSHARERLVLQVLKEKMDITDWHVLHLSPEKNLYTFLAQRSRVTAADIQPGFYHHITKGVEKQDATQLTYPDNTFDLMIANHVLEHIPEDEQAMREFFRVLKPGARAILQVPYSDALDDIQEQMEINDPEMQSRLFGQKDHVRVYSCNGYMKRLTNAGFEVRFVPYEHLSQWYVYAIQAQEGFFEIQKPVI